MASDKIKKRFYLNIAVTLTSPMCIGAGGGTTTDMDVIRDYENNPFIPATSIVGAIRAMLTRTYKNKKIIAQMFGDKGKENGKMSNIIVCDSNFKKGCNKEVRELVALDEQRISRKGAKFNTEALSAGSVFNIKMEGIVRKENQGDYQEWINALSSVVQAIDKGLIRFGSKTKRGFGKIEVNKDASYFIEYEQETNALGWLDFDWEDEKNKDYCLNFNKKLLTQEFKVEKHQTTISLDIKNTSSVNIRSYPKGSLDNDINDDNDIDMVMFKSYDKNGNLVPVIPGTSWTGAIRHWCNRVLSELLSQLKIEDKNNQIRKGYINDCFGDVGENYKIPSKITVDESFIYDSRDIHITRVKIDRFTGGAVDGALFDERPAFLGRTSLCINVRNESESGRNSVVGLMLLAMRDICNGILPVGGETAIGRGIFEAVNEKDFLKSVKIDGKEINEQDIEYYQKELLTCIKGRG